MNSIFFFYIKKVTNSIWKSSCPSIWIIYIVSILVIEIYWVAISKITILVKFQNQFWTGVLDMFYNVLMIRDKYIKKGNKLNQTLGYIHTKSWKHLGSSFKFPTILLRYINKLIQPYLLSSRTFISSKLQNRQNYMNISISSYFKFVISWRHELIFFIYFFHAVRSILSL